MLARVQPYTLTAILLALIAYFAFHALTGERGMLSADQRDVVLARRHAELTHVRAQRMDLEARARLLRNGSLSADLLEERARSLLGFADPRDYVIRITKP